MNDEVARCGDLVEHTIGYSLKYYGKVGIVLEDLGNGYLKVAWNNDGNTFDYVEHRASAVRPLRAGR